MSPTAAVLRHLDQLEAQPLDVPAGVAASGHGVRLDVVVADPALQRPDVYPQGAGGFAGGHEVGHGRGRSGSVSRLLPSFCRGWCLLLLVATRSDHHCVITNDDRAGKLCRHHDERTT